MRRTKIVCTLGPATATPEAIAALVEAGMDVARLNFSHGSYDTHLQNIQTIRAIAAQRNKPIAILQDLQGPKIRIGEMEEGVVLVPGAKAVITMEDTMGTAARFSSTYKDLAKDVNEGEPILINDGLLCIRVDKITGEDIHGTVIHGGPLTSHKGINLSESSISAPALTDKDLQDLDFGLAHDVDYVALSFVSEASDIKQVKDAVKRKNKGTLVVAKVERHEAIANMESIVMAADVIMVARGDLGVEIPLERVPNLQKKLIQCCQKHMKPAIVATQMLESMITNPRPTRAEASDVANAILDGADAIMLSGETAVGKYPVEAVTTMTRIAAEIEPGLTSVRDYIFDGYVEHSVPNSVSHAACRLAENLNAAAIICFTNRGYTARVLSKYRQPIPVIAVTPSELVYRQMALHWGTRSLRLDEVPDTDEMIAQVEVAAEASGYLAKGDLVVVTAGLPMPIGGVTNQIRVHRVGAEFAL